MQNHEYLSAAVTQLVECPAVNRLVTGSSPVGGVTLFLFTKNFFASQKPLLKIQVSLVKLTFFSKERFVLKENGNKNIFSHCFTEGKKVP